VAARGAFYREWITANGLAEAAGLGTTFVLGRALAPILAAESSARGVIAGALGAVVAGIVLEGVVVGWGQGWVLGRHLPGVPATEWVRATAIGAGAAWLIGMIPSTAIGLLQVTAPGGPAASGGPPAAEPPKLLQYGLAVPLGAVTGPILGAVQARVLRWIAGLAVGAVHGRCLVPRV
jgi:hypothetical protein